MNTEETGIHPGKKYLTLERDNPKTGWGFSVVASKNLGQDGAFWFGVVSSRHEVGVS